MKTRMFFSLLALSVACDSSMTGSSGNGPDGGMNPGTDGGTNPGAGPTLAGCPLLPANHVFNTPIDALPTHPSSATYMTTIGTRNLHLDLGRTVDQQSATYYGIPYNVVTGGSLSWSKIAFYSPDPGLNWNPRPEADCAVGANHSLVAPCLATTAPNPLLPIPSGVLVEGGVNTAANQMPYGDHHILVLDSDTCRLWETYHSYPDGTGGWNIFGSATWDLRSNALRPAGWTSADAAGFPILPLLLRAAEANSGEIKHALRFTIQSSKIRASYVWPARHLTGSNNSTSLPQMGQLFRIKSSYVIPTTFNTQARAIVQAMKTYGMYIADGGSDWYVQGEPSADWQDQTISQVQSVSSSNFEAVDIAAITGRAGFDANSGAVPP